MNRRIVSLLIAGSIIIVILLIGAAVLRVILSGSASVVPTLPVMPTYDSVFSTITPLPTLPPASISTNTPEPVIPTQAGPATQTLSPLFILNRTPIYPTTSGNASARTPTPTPLSATIWTYTPTPTSPSVIVRTSTPTSTSAVPLAGPCRNILYPMAVGQQWLYQSSALNRSDILNMSVLSVSSSQGAVQINNQSTGTTKQVQVQCDGDVIRSFPFMSVDAIFGNSLNSDLSASYISGVLAPNEAAFLNNNWALAWSSQYLVSGTTVIERGGNQINVTLNNAPVTLNCQTLAAGDAAFETVSVGAGTFRALKVVCIGQGQVTAVVNGITVTGPAEGRSYQWFAPRIGLVKMQVVSVTVRVFDLPFSILTNNSLELRSYISAP